MFFFSVFSSSSHPGIFAKQFNSKTITIDVSGSSKQSINGSLQLTKPEYAIYPFDKQYDWCSNCPKSYDDLPWISFSIENKKIKFKSFFIRGGCCYTRCCCDGDYYGCVRCCLYSWSLQISDDNKTWTEVHRVEKDSSMKRCNEKTYSLDKEYTAKYVRLVQNEPCPGDPLCIALNKFEIYGDTISDDGNYDFISYHDDDEDDISIIGHISRNNINN